MIVLTIAAYVALGTAYGQVRTGPESLPLAAESRAVVLLRAPNSFPAFRPFEKVQRRQVLAALLANSEGLGTRTFLLRGVDPNGIEGALAFDPEVESVEPDFYVRLHGTDRFRDLQWGLESDVPGGTSAALSWSDERPRNPVKVAVLDTGISYRHPDLVGKISALYNALEPDGRATDDSGHGTHCVGIIAARRDNREGIAGISDDAAILAVKTHHGGEAALSDILRGLAFAKREGARIVSMSWGAPTRMRALETAIRETPDVLFVTSSGNGGGDGLGDNLDERPEFPAVFELPNLITVGAHDRDGRIASFSNFSPRRPILTAPGAQIVSTIPGGYGYKNGTSMAAPHVSGAAAVLLSIRPSMTPVEVIRVLRESADVPVEGSRSSSYGRLNLSAALRAI